MGRESGLIGEVDHSARRAKIGECPGKSEVEVGFRDGTGDSSCNTELRNSSAIIRRFTDKRSQGQVWRLTKLVCLSEGT